MKRLGRVPLSVVVAVAVAVVLTTTGLVLDLVDEDVSAWFGDHQFATALLGNAIVLLVTYAIVDALIELREARRWRNAARRPMEEFLIGCHTVQRHANLAVFADELPHSLARAQERGEALRDVVLASPHLTRLLDPLTTILSVLRGGRRAFEVGMPEKGREASLHAVMLATGFADDASTYLDARLAVGATGKAAPADANRSADRRVR